MTRLTVRIRLHAVPHDRPVLGPKAVLGKARHIYAFPRASNLVKAGGKVYVAWLDETEQMHLSSWSPDAGVLETEALGHVPWNTTLAMAANGKDLLIAWHEIVDGEGAVIRTRHRTLP